MDILKAIRDAFVFMFWLAVWVSIRVFMRRNNEIRNDE